MDSNKDRYRICIAYDGTDFYGWQKQPNQPSTVQGLLEKGLSKIYNAPIALVGSGRTDRGVHALNQWAHFDLPKESDVKDLRYKLNRMSPDTIVVKTLQKAPQDFHAQISAVTKCYKYRVIEAKPPNPFQNRFALQPHRSLNVEYLQELAEILRGEHDFSSFQSKGTPVTSPVRHLLISRWIRRKSGVLEYQVKGTGFLKQMVRNLVGTMLKLEQLQAPVDDLRRILKGRDRTLAAAPAPAQGLFLTSVQYPQALDNKCRKL